MPKGILVALFLAGTAATAHANNSQSRQQPRINVVLDRSTFPGPTYANMQETANRVAQEVNTLIPGTPEGYNQLNVVCYEGTIDQPETTVGPLRPQGYPSDRSSDEIRIGVAVQPDNTKMLAYQLAHELAHVKMGARKDNYIVEMFAVDVSFEVLKRLGFSDMLASEFRESPNGLELQWPPDVYLAVLWRADGVLANYWQSQLSQQEHLNHKNWDYPLSSVGALVVAFHGQLIWSNLLNIADLSVACRPMFNGAWTNDCQPEMKRLLVRQPVLKWLGYKRSQIRCKRWRSDNARSLRRDEEIRRQCAIRAKV